MEELNTPAIAQAPSIAEQNMASLKKANEAADRLIELIKQTEIKDTPEVRFLDEQCKSFVQKAAKTAAVLMERRKPVTQAFDAMRKYFTDMENELKKGEKIKAITAFRDKFAAHLAEEERKAEEERARKAALEQERIDLKASIKKAFNEDLSRQINTACEALENIFNAMTLKTVATTKDGVRDFATEYAAPSITAPPLKLVSPVEFGRMVSEAAPSLSSVCEDEFKRQVEEKKRYYLDRVESRRQELVAIAEADIAERERLEKEAEERARAEAEKRKQELLSFGQRQDAEVEAEKAEASLQTLFDGYAPRAANVKKTLRIEILGPAAYARIFAFWFEREGKDLTYEKIEKFTVARMKKFCEDLATKTGEIVESNMLRYVEEVTAR